MRQKKCTVGIKCFIEINIKNSGDDLLTWCMPCKCNMDNSLHFPCCCNLWLGSERAQWAGGHGENMVCVSGRERWRKKILHLIASRLICAVRPDTLFIYLLCIPVFQLQAMGFSPYIKCNMYCWRLFQFIDLWSDCVFC